MTFERSSWGPALHLSIAALGLCVACAGGDTRSSASGGARAKPDASSPSVTQLCSGCASETRDPRDSAAHFHHVHLNTHSKADSIDYYERIFGAEHVFLNGRADAIHADGALLLLHEVASQPTDILGAGIEHFGWGRVDLQAWWLDHQGLPGVMLDQRSFPLDGPFPLYPDYYFLYLQGPSNERIEVETETEEFARFKHVHFMTDDVDTTVAFYEQLLDVKAQMDAATLTTLQGELGGKPLTWTANMIQIDKVKMWFFGPPCSCVPEAFVPSDDLPMGHVAFAFSDLGVAVTRADALGAEMVSEPRIDEAAGFRSAFVRGPNQVLIELVEAAKVPEQSP